MSFEIELKQCAAIDYLSRKIEKGSDSKGQSWQETQAYSVHISCAGQETTPKYT